MELCSKACKVELAQGRAEIEAMPNGSELLSIYTENGNDIETYRDVLYYVGQVLGDQPGREAGTSEIEYGTGADVWQQAQVFFQLF